MNSPGMATFTSHSPEDTERFGEKLGREATPGRVFGLIGDLGAGKTRLARGIARGLGVREAILSPTFGLVHEHRGGRLPLFHLDFYRLDNADAILAAGLTEHFEPGNGVTVIEWYDRWDGPPPSKLTRVWLRAAGDTHRFIEYDDPGP
jgi:tRNA threonylcarbamoyladenosine biosynthesis protein TsaE